MRRRLIRNAAANSASAAMPALAMLITLPLLVRYLGVEDFGVLTMVMAITGYFAIVDINVTAGSVKYVAEFHAKHDLNRVYQVISFGAAFYLTLGLFGAIGIYFGSPYLVRWLFDLQEARLNMVVDVMRLAAFGFFFSQFQAYLNSIPQALQRFDITAVAEALFGTLVPVLTVVILWLGYGLREVVILRVVASGLHGGVLVWMTFRLLPQFRYCMPERETSRMLWSFSGYAYLSRLAALTNAQADKLIVGGLLGMTALAYYSVAAQIISRITTLTFRLSSVIYPAASAMQATGDLNRLKSIYFTASRYITYINGAAILLVCLYGREILHYWMGPEFAVHGYWVMVLMAIAMFLDSLTNLPSLVNDAFGKPRNTGLFALLRVFFATGMTYFLAIHFDLDLVALGQALSALFFVIGFIVFIHGRAVPWAIRELLASAYARPFSAFVLLLAFSSLLRQSPLMTLPLALFEALITGCLAALLGYFWVLDQGHRHMIRSRLPVSGFFIRGRK